MNRIQTVGDVASTSGMGDNILMQMRLGSVWVSVLICVCVSGTARSNTATSHVPLSLQDAVAIALKQHPTLHIGQADIDAADYRVRQRIADYLPSGAYTYNYTRQERSVSAAVGGAASRTVTTTFNFHSTNVALRQLLFDFGRTLDAIRAASASADASRFDLAAIQQDVTFNAKQAFYSLLSSQRLLHVAEETVRQNQQLLGEAQARFEVGLVPFFDVTQSRVQLSNAQLDRVTARNNVSLAQETLRTAMGITGPFVYTPVDTLEQMPLGIDETSVLQAAYAHRPELRSATLRQEAATRRVAERTKQYLPSVSGNAQYNWIGREHPLQTGWLWGVTLTVPIFDDIRTHAQVGEARADLRRTKAEYENLRQQVALEVRQSLLTLQQAEEQIRVSQQVERQAQENLDLAEGRYTTGVGNIIELTDAQVSLTSAQANHIQALYSFKTALADLERSVGKPLE